MQFGGQLLLEVLQLFGVAISLHVESLYQVAEALEVEVVVEQRHVLGHGESALHVLVRRH